MARVFMPEPPRADLDVSRAQEYGPVTCIFERHGPPVRGDGKPSVFDPEYFCNAFNEELEKRGFKPDEDYLLLTGSVFAVTLAFAAVVLKWGRVRSLVYNASMGRYVEKEFHASEIRGSAHCAA
jgi:hypothetical protein